MSVLGVDSQRALESVRRRVAEAPVQLAEGFASVVRSAPEHRLERLMRSPARRVILDAIFWQMPQHVDRQRAGGASGTIRWEITRTDDGSPDTYQLELADGICRVVRGPAGAPARLTITAGGADFLRLATGNLDPMQAYFGGKVKLAGDIMLAAKLASLFRIPGRRPQPKT